MSLIKFGQLPPSILLRTLKKADTASTLHKLFFTCNWMKEFLESYKMDLTHLVGHVTLTDIKLTISNDFMSSVERKMFSKLETSEKAAMLKGLYVSLKCSYDDPDDIRDEQKNADRMWDFLVKLSKQFREQGVSFKETILTLPSYENVEQAHAVVQMLKPQKLILDNAPFSNCFCCDENEEPWFSPCDDVTSLECSFVNIEEDYLCKMTNVYITINTTAGSSSGEYIYYSLDDFISAFKQHPNPRLQSFEVLCKARHGQEIYEPQETVMNWLGGLQVGSIHSERACQWSAGTFDQERSFLFLCRLRDSFVVHQYHDKVVEKFTAQDEIFYRMTVIKNLEDVEKWTQKKHYNFLPGLVEKMAKVIEEKLQNGEHELEEEEYEEKEGDVEIKVHFEDYDDEDYLLFMI